MHTNNRVTCFQWQILLPFWSLISPFRSCLEILQFPLFVHISSVWHVNVFGSENVAQHTANICKLFCFLFNCLFIARQYCLSISFENKVEIIWKKKWSPAAFIKKDHGVKLKNNISRKNLSKHNLIYFCKEKFGLSHNKFNPKW